jgi:RND family efflux transporter MFP subunit
LWSLALLILALVVAGFFVGFLPRQRRDKVLLAEAKTDSGAIPTVNVAPVERAPADAELVLPGSLQAITEAPVLARASGYVRRRLADIGDRVTEGQVLAEIEGPELEQQIRQAEATLEQTRAAAEQARAALEQGRANARLAEVTARRWSNLAAKGVVSRQENDTYQAQNEAQRASVQALEKAVAAAQASAGASEAALARLRQLLNYQNVRAPFAGIITLRNVEAGTLIAEGATLLYRIAQTGRLRAFVNLPQNDAAAVKTGQAALLTLPNLPGRQFAGTVTRGAGALDPATRTLLTEVQVPNDAGLLLPGMYVQVILKIARRDPPLLIPGDTLVVRGDGPQVAVVSADGTVRYQRIRMGRDYGDRIEVLDGLRDGDQVVINPGDTIRNGVIVNPLLLRRQRAS